MKTIREIAEICGVSEQAVRAWCRKNHIAKDVSQSAKADYAVNQAIIDLLRKELDHKNKQIDELSKRLMECQKLLDQEQQLRMVTEQKILIEDQEELPKKWWKFWE